MSLNSIAQAIRLASRGLGVFATTRLAASGTTALTSITSGATIAALNDPYVGQGLGTTTYTTFGTVPGQLGLTGSSIVAGSSALTAGATYSIGVEATSGDGRRKVGETLAITAQGVAATLSPLTLSSTAFSTGGTTSVGINNKSAGSTITATSADGTTLTVTGSTLTGTFTTAGSPTITMVETLSGAANSPRTSTVACTVAAATAATYAAVAQNTQPATTYANPISDTFVVSTAATLSGTTENSGAYTWAYYSFGTNPGSHSKEADGSGVGGNSAGRAGTILGGYTALDAEISADVQILVTSSEGKVSLIGRVDSTSTTGTYYEFQQTSTYTQVFRTTNGTAVQLGGVSTSLAANTTSNMRLRIVDVGDGTTSIRGFINNVEVLSVIDATPLETTGWGLLGGRYTRYKNFNLGTWQLQQQVAYTPNVYDQSAPGAIVTALSASAAGATLTLASNDGGRFALADTGFNTAGFHQYNLVTTSTTTKISDGNARSIQVTEAKTGYTSVTTTLPLGVVAPLPSRPVRLASTGGLIPNAIVTSGTNSVLAYQSQVPFYVGSDDKYTLQFTFDNWQLAGGEITGFNNGLTISKASFHIPGAPIPLVPVTFSRSRSLTLASGDAAILSDALLPAQFGLKVFPRGTMGWMRSHGSVAAVSGASQSLPCGRYVNTLSGGGSYCERGSAVTNSQVDVTTNMVGTGGTSQQQSVGATTMVGKSVNTGVLSVFGLGDSIMDGLYDTSYATAYGKSWLPRAASDNINGGGTAGSLIAFMQGSHSGDSDWAINSGSTTRVSKYWAYSNVLIDEFDTNDIGSAGVGTSITTMHNNAVSTWNLFKTAAPGGKIVRTTLQPRTTPNGLLSSVTSDGNGTATATIAANGVVLPATGTVVPGVTMYNSTTTGFNVTAPITVTSSTTFTYPIATTVAAGTAGGTMSVGDGGASQWFQTVDAGWGVGGARDQIVALYRTDLSNGVIDAIIDTLPAVSPSSDPTRWLGGYSSEGTHPYQAAGNGAMAIPTRSTLLGLTGLA